MTKKKPSQKSAQDGKDLEVTNQIDTLLSEAAVEENLEKMNEQFSKAAELNTQIVQSDTP